MAILAMRNLRMALAGFACLAGFDGFGAERGSKTLLTSVRDAQRRLLTESEFTCSTRANSCWDFVVRRRLDAGRHAHRDRE